MMCDLLLLAVLGDAVIGQVGVPVRDLIEVEVGRREANIGLCVDPDRQRVPISHKDPLADVELAALHEQRVLDVLLADVRLALRLITDRLLARPVANHVQHLGEVPLEADATPPRASSRLHYPNVSLAVQVELWVLFANLVKDFHGLGKLGIPRSEQLVIVLLFLSGL